MERIDTLVSPSGRWPNNRWHKAWMGLKARLLLRLSWLVILLSWANNGPGRKRLRSEALPSASCPLPMSRSKSQPTDREKFSMRRLNVCFAFCMGEERDDYDTTA